MQQTQGKTTTKTKTTAAARQTSLLSFVKTVPRSKSSTSKNSIIATTTKSRVTANAESNDITTHSQSQEDSVSLFTGRVTPDTDRSPEKIEDSVKSVESVPRRLPGAIEIEESQLSSRDNNQGLSEYELLRQRNIERNNARLAALGLLRNTGTVTNHNPVKPPPRRKRPVSQSTPTLPVRRSTRRQRTGDAHNTNNDDNHNNSGDYTSESINKTPIMDEDVSTDVEATYTVSPIMQYVMTPSGDLCDAEIRHVQSLSPLQKRLIPPSRLGAIYSLQFFQDTSWLVGAGKAGVIAVWDASSTSNNKPENDAVDPILSWKAHGGRWIAEATFLPSQHQQPSRLLTAANDGAVCLWDLTTVSVQEAVPRLLMRTGKELHASGIFALDVQAHATEPLFATASKDKTVKISTLGADVGWWTSHHHSAKVGDVRFRGVGSSLLASVGDDGLVVIHDFKSHRIVAESSQAHSRPHSVVWHPSQEHVFMTAGHDTTIKLWDIRRFGNHASPLGILEGHVPLHETKCKKIHRPIFYNSSEHSTLVLTGGQSSYALSIFQCHHGYKHPPESVAVSLCSRGKLPFDCGDAGCIAVDKQRVAVATEQAEVLLLRPSPNEPSNDSIALL